MLLLLTKTEKAKGLVAKAVCMGAFNSRFSQKLYLLLPKENGREKVYCKTIYKRAVSGFTDPIAILSTVCPDIVWLGLAPDGAVRQADGSSLGGAIKSGGKRHDQ